LDRWSTGDDDDGRGESGGDGDVNRREGGEEAGLGLNERAGANVNEADGGVVVVVVVVVVAAANTASLNFVHVRGRGHAQTCPSLFRVRDPLVPPYHLSLCSEFRPLQAF